MLSIVLETALYANRQPALIMVMLVGVSRLVGRMIPLSLSIVAGTNCRGVLRAQRLELYSLSRHHQIGDDVLREVLGELDLSEANIGLVK